MEGWDRRRLVARGSRYLMWSMIVDLIGGIVAIAITASAAMLTLMPSYIYSTGVSTSVSINGSSVFLNETAPASALAAQSALQALPRLTIALYVILVASAAAGAIVLALQWIGWSSLRAADSRYSLGRTGVLLGIVGFALAIVALAIISSALSYAVRAVALASPGAPATSVPPGAAAFLAAMMGGAILALAGGAAALVGGIMIWIGLWRLDSDYGNGLVRASIILSIVAILSAFAVFAFPSSVLVSMALGLISYILMIIGLHEVAVRARSAS